jgi:hypothetical protein
MKKMLLFPLLFIGKFCLAQNVGIGTTSPQKLLSVNGAMVVDQGNSNTGTSSTGALSFGSLSGEAIGSKRNSGTGQFGLDFYTNGINRMTVSNSGNVGINIINPSSKLEIRGALGFSSVSKRWEMSYDSTNGYFYIDEYGSGRRLYIKNGGNVGINTSNPQATLDVNGDVNIQNKLLFNNSAGNDGQVLVSSGMASAPTWQNIAYSNNDRFYYTVKLNQIVSAGIFNDTILYDTYYANSSAISYSSTGIFTVNKTGLYNISASFLPIAYCSTASESPLTVIGFNIKYPAASLSQQNLYYGKIDYISPISGSSFFGSTYAKEWKIHMVAGTQFYFSGAVISSFITTSSGFGQNTELSINLISE